MRLDNVLVTCVQGNLASERVIKFNGGFFDREVPRGDDIIKHYWINVTTSLLKNKGL